MTNTQGMKTVGQILEELQKLQTSEQAMRYLIDAMKDNPHSLNNIRYISGYLGAKERERLMQLFFGEG